MNPPQVYMCSPSWTLFPPPSPYHPSGSSQCTSPKHPVSCIKPGLAARFIHDILHVSMPFSQIFPPSPSPTELGLAWDFLKRLHGTASFAGCTHFSSGKNSAAGPGLGLASATQTCFPEASSSVPDPVLALAPAWTFVFHSLFNLLWLLGHTCVSLALYLWAQPATHVPCVWAFLHNTCHPESLACSFWVEITPISSLVIAWIDFLYLSTLIQGIVCIYMGCILL